MQSVIGFWGIFVFVGFNAFAQETIIRNSVYENYMLHFKKLTDKEILFYQYGEFKFDEEIYTFKICAKNTENGHERLIGYWTTPYGRYQLSGTKKEMIFAAVERGRFLSLFLVNGTDGIVIYLLDVDNSARTSKDLRYLMYNDAPGGKETGEPFVLINLHKLKIIRTLYWKISPLDGGGSKIYRSLDDAYDFRIDYEVEGSLYATCYYSVSTDTLRVTLDDTGVPYERTLKREQIRPEELGF